MIFSKACLCSGFTWNSTTTATWLISPSPLRNVRRSRILPDRVASAIVGGDRRKEPRLPAIERHRRKLSPVERARSFRIAENLETELAAEPDGHRHPGPEIAAGIMDAVADPDVR